MSRQELRESFRTQGPRLVNSLPPCPRTSRGSLQFRGKDHYPREIFIGEKKFSSSEERSLFSEDFCQREEDAFMKRSKVAWRSVPDTLWSAQLGNLNSNLE